MKVHYFDPAKRDRLAGDGEDSGAPWAETLRFLPE
jgi:hypothetical protein